MTELDTILSDHPVNQAIEVAHLSLKNNALGGITMKINDISRTINDVLADNGLILADNTTIVVERPFTRPLKRWGHILTIAISNNNVSASTDWEGEVDEDDIDRVIYYFLGEYGAEDIMSITVK